MREVQGEVEAKINTIMEKQEKVEANKASLTKHIKKIKADIITMQKKSK